MNVFYKYKRQIEHAFRVAESGTSQITKEILEMEGMTGKKTRHFYNALLDMEDARYLEIGTWRGSSSCSAMCGNAAKVLCIDNWSEFGGPKDDFLKNFETYKGRNDATFIENDCFMVDTKYLPLFNVYLYDGNHTQDSHYRALLHYIDNLDDTFIFIVDDWNWQEVRNGTYESIKKLNLEILYEKEIRLTMDNTHSPQPLAGDTWWNGIYVAILKKRLEKGVE
jgi:hypothetical protein